MSHNHRDKAAMEIVLAKPRGFCAGVVRAVDIVESALEIYGSHVYVFHEIVHNPHVVQALKARGAVFVENLTDIPHEAITIFSAHGVSPAVNQEAQEKRLHVIDATCPLVAKVHMEVARHARDGREVILIGHAGHPEVRGTLGHYDAETRGRIHLVQNIEEARTLSLNNPHHVAFVTQTTLSMDDTARIIEVLRQRFPAILGPRQDDICYATQNRQAAVRRMAEHVDLLLVVGARNSSNSNRLREVGEQMGITAYLVQDAHELQANWFHEVNRVGVTAGASAPEVLVQDVLNKLRGLGVHRITELEAESETITFRLPSALAKKMSPRIN